MTVSPRMISVWIEKKSNKKRTHVLWVEIETHL